MIPKMALQLLKMGKNSSLVNEISYQLSNLIVYLTPRNLIGILREEENLTESETVETSHKKDDS